MRASQAVFVLLLLVPMGPAPGQEALDRVNLPGESAATARRLTAADRLLADSKWTEAIEELQRIIDEAGDDLVPVERLRLVEARRLCHLRLSRLPEEPLRQYRTRVDARAKGWLDRADAERDPRWLTKIVEEAFASTSTASALDRLGDLAFEQGDFDTAESWWRRLLPAEARKEVSDDDPVQCPDARIEPARTHAKLLLARLFRGDRHEAAAALAAYGKQYPAAAGSLAGRTGKYVDTLKGVAATIDHSVVASTWPTFAGSPARQSVLPKTPLPLDRLPLFEAATWTWNLDRQAEARRRPDPAAEASRSLPFHPVIVGQRAVTADARCVRFHDLRSGEQQIWDLIDDGKRDVPGLALELPAPAGLAYTLSAAGNFVYARLGCQKLRARADGDRKGELDSFLVCLRLEPDARGQRLVWIEEARKGALFEGAPLVYAGRAYVALSHFENGNIATSIACYVADTGTPAWRKPVEVCTVHDFGQSEARQRHQLLALAGNRLVFCTHSGAIVALDPESGRRVWSRRYASRGHNLRSPRELAPCVCARGCIFAAPADCERILCLDADSGALVWESEPPAEVVHLLGVAQGRLIFTTPHDIRALDLQDGHTLRDWIKPADGVDLPPSGRGLLAGDFVLWPTVNGLRALDQRTGRVAPLPLNTSANQLRGNLAAVAGCLLIADATQLQAYLAR